MTTLLLIESNTPDMIAAGYAPASDAFVTTFATFDVPPTTRIAHPYASPLTHDDLNGVDGVVFTGSSVPWATDAPQAAPLRAAMELVFAHGVPTWGSCNGLQLATVVLGGETGASPNGLEVGLAKDIRVTPQGIAHPMLAHRTDGYSALCIHRDEVRRAPRGATIVAGNAHSPVQAMVYAQDGVDFWGTQYHPECSAAALAGFLRDGSIFDDHMALVSALEHADTDPEAAAVLGTTPDALAPAMRAVELRAWLEHVAGVQAVAVSANRETYAL